MMTECSIMNVFRATRCLPILILKLCFMVWTYDLIRSANSTQITDQICRNAVNSPVESICCQLIIERDEDLKACLFHLNTSNSGGEDAKLINLSKFTECIYKRKQYMKSDSKLNIRRVKAEANRLYHNDSLRKNFMINMYLYCARTAVEDLENFDANSEVLEVISHHRPYFMFHYVCLANYPKSQCPYFVWRGKGEDNNQRCSDFAAECVNNFKAQE